MASMGLSIDEQKAVDRFRKAVVDPSQTKLVILDFWAEWCGPCKALTPVLEKVAAEYADKGVVLAKINVDEEQFIAAQFQVRSIPTVYAMFQGQPVADLTSARGAGIPRSARPGCGRRRENSPAFPCVKLGAQDCCFWLFRGLGHAAERRGHADPPGWERENCHDQCRNRLGGTDRCGKLQRCLCRHPGA